MSPYLEQVRQDFGLLGFNLGSLDKGPIQNYSGLIRLLFATMDIRTQHKNMLDPAQSMKITTSIGKRALNLMMEGGFDFCSGSYGACDATETRLVENVIKSDASDYHEFNTPPIIVTDDDKPVAIIKGFGEDSCYGLETNIDLGIMEAVISGHIAEVIHTPLADHAWQVPVSDFRDGFYPIRFSAFSIPVSAREPLIDKTCEFDRRGVLVTSHEAILEQAHVLLEDAEPLPQPIYS